MHMLLYFGYASIIISERASEFRVLSTFYTIYAMHASINMLIFFGCVRVAGRSSKSSVDNNNATNVRIINVKF